MATNVELQISETLLFALWSKAAVKNNFPF